MSETCFPLTSPYNIKIDRVLHETKLLVMNSAPSRRQCCVSGFYLLAYLVHE